MIKTMQKNIWRRIALKYALSAKKEDYYAVSKTYGVINDEMLYITQNDRTIPFYKGELYAELARDGFLISEYADEDTVRVNFLISRENIEKKAAQNKNNTKVKTKRKGPRK